MPFRQLVAMLTAHSLCPGLVLSVVSESLILSLIVSVVSQLCHVLFFVCAPAVCLCTGMCIPGVIKFMTPGVYIFFLHIG